MDEQKRLHSEKLIESNSAEESDADDTKSYLDTHAAGSRQLPAGSEMEILTNQAPTNRRNRRETYRLIGIGGTQNALPILRSYLVREVDLVARIYLGQAIRKVAERASVELTVDEWREITGGHCKAFEHEGELGIGVSPAFEKTQRLAASELGIVPHPFSEIAECLLKALGSSSENVRHQAAMAVKARIETGLMTVEYFCSNIHLIRQSPQPPSTTDKQLRDLAERLAKVDRIEELVLLLSGKIDRILEHQDLIIGVYRTRELELSTSFGLTPDQDQLFERLERISGKDEIARISAERELTKLKGAPATKQLVKRLQAYLRSRGWGIKTPGGEAASPVWQPDRSAPLGGYLTLSYYLAAARRSTQTSGTSAVPTISLVPKPDRRRRTF